MYTIVNPIDGLREYNDRKKFRTKKSANELMKNSEEDWKRAEIEKY